MVILAFGYTCASVIVLHCARMRWAYAMVVKVRAEPVVMQTRHRYLHLTSCIPVGLQTKRESVFKRDEDSVNLLETAVKVIFSKASNSRECRNGPPPGELR
jgi:hypothetical protein